MSTRITTGMTQRSILSDLNAVSERLSRTQGKVASSREITRPSDDPFNASRAMHLRESMAGTRQHQRNVSDARGWQEAAEQALGNITGAVHRVRDLLVQAASDTTDPAARDAIRVELDQLVEGIKQEANATYRGRHVFAGTRTDQPPYLPGAADAYQGTPDDIYREIGPGVSLAINVRGDQFLGSGGGDGKLLSVLRRISTDLAAGNGAALRGADLVDLDRNLDDLLGLRAANGARSNRLEAAGARLAEVEESTLSQLSQTEDADIGRTLIDLNSQTAAYQAALRAGASIVQSSLMDFLR